YKINHNELLTYPNKFDQIRFGTVKDAWELGAVALGATIYFGSAESDRQIQEISAATHEAHEQGMATVLWVHVRHPACTNDADKPAVMNKRAGGTGLITGRKAFMRHMSEGIQLLNAVQDVYLMDEVTVA